MFTNIWDSLKEFLQLDVQKRALLISYILFGGIIYFQYRTVETYREEKNNFSKSVYEIQLENEKHCQQLLLSARNRYQDNLERDRDIYQNKIDSLIDAVSMLKRRYKSDNIKLIKKIHENE